MNGTNPTGIKTPPFTDQSDSSPPILLDFRQPYLSLSFNYPAPLFHPPLEDNSLTRSLSLSLSLSLMASTNTLHYRHHRHHDHRHRCRHHHHNLSLFKHTSVSLRQPSSSSSSTTNAFSLSSAAAANTSAAAASSAEPVITFDVLANHLTNKEFRQADEETRRLLIQLAGEAAQKRGYVFFSEVQFISRDDLRAIDNLWTKHSEGRFGYSVQRRIWTKVNRDFTRFFIKVGWMKKLDTEVEQYNYRSFPNEFTWELNEDTPEGHLPLTNALRGTQLLNSILSHPAFEAADGGQVGGEENESTEEENRGGSVNGGRGKQQRQRVLKPDYTF